MAFMTAVQVKLLQVTNSKKKKSILYKRSFTMDNIIYMGYGFTLNDLDESRLTDDEQNALDMLVENVKC